uniref:BACK domain-containing protein n=1 Tax=Macrostomum lignano TaxID=282301 RepID=A0A1I8FEI9_9PLAT
LPDYPRSDGRAQADEVLRRCRVLFHFARKPILITDQAFQDDVRAWLIELAALCCVAPPGVSTCTCCASCSAVRLVHGPIRGPGQPPSGEQPQHQQQQQQQDDSTRWIFVDEEGEAYDNQRDALTEAARYRPASDCGLIELESRLTALSPSEAIYLLTSLSNVACQCDASVPDQRKLLLSITDEIFNLAFVREHTRDLCGKVGCELLTSIGLRHPLVLREMLDYVDRAKLDMDVLSLFKDLPFQTFVPDKALLTRFLHWLTLYPLKSLRSCIARLVLDGFNWSVDFNSVDGAILSLVREFDGPTPVAPDQPADFECSRCLLPSCGLTGSIRSLHCFAACSKRAWKLTTPASSCQPA